MDFNESSSSTELNHSFDGPPLTDYLLTAADILVMKLTAKLVVLSSGHSDDRAGRINSDGVVGLTRAILAAGAQCVLFSLWPVPEAASKMFMKAFYTSLLQVCVIDVWLVEGLQKVILYHGVPTNIKCILIYCCRVLRQARHYLRP